MRFDDTNPTREEVEYVNSILAMTCAGWAGTGATTCYYASDYFEQLYEMAVDLIRKGKAYVDDLSFRGNPGVSGHLDGAGAGESRTANRLNRSENLDLFQRMRAGEFDEGSRVLRAKRGYGVPQPATCATRCCIAS